MRATPILLALAALFLCQGARAEAAEAELILRLASGRQFAGTIGAQTDEKSLVLQSSRGGATISRPISWERIVGATLDGQAVTVEELRTRAKEAAVPAVVRAPWSAERKLESGDTGQGTGDRRQGTGSVSVTTIAFDARIANWDADVETDGLIVDLLPLDGEGYLAPASGAVEIELFAPQRRVFHHAPLSGGDTLERVERWVQPIEAADFTANGIRLRLPFGAVHPEFDTDWLASHYGLVHVRLAAPGHGTFDASRDGIRIRPWAPNRDQLELNTHRRFFPTEAVGRHN